MFDVGFSEILVIALVALLVIGPERLPKVARTLGHLFGRMQRYVNNVKADISREMELDELRNFQATVDEAARAIHQSVTSEGDKFKTEMQSLGAETTAALSATSVATPAPTPEAETPAEIQPSASNEVTKTVPDKASLLQEPVVATDEVASAQMELDLTAHNEPPHKKA